MKALRYAKRLIGFDSTSHKSNREISRYLEMKLTKHGFVIERVEYPDRNGELKVNLIAKKGSGEGGLGYFGHSDVVPAEQWFTKKFTGFQPAIAAWDELKKPLYITITADEEVGFAGAQAVVNESKHYREMAYHRTKAIIGEPTMLEVVHAHKHKGSVKITATATGVAGHSGGRIGESANLKMIPFLAEMKNLRDETETEKEWQDKEFDPPTLSWNIVIKDDAPAFNVTAGQSVCNMYLRPMPKIQIEPILERIRQAAVEFDLSLDMKNWGPGMYRNSLKKVLSCTPK